MQLGHAVLLISATSPGPGYIIPLLLRVRKRRAGRRESAQRSGMGTSGGPRKYFCVLSFFHSDVGAVRTDIATSWRHSLTNFVAALLSIGMTRKIPSPTWSGSKLFTKRLVTVSFWGSF